MFSEDQWPARTACLQSGKRWRIWCILALIFRSLEKELRLSRYGHLRATSGRPCVLLDSAEIWRAMRIVDFSSVKYHQCFVVAGPDLLPNVRRQNDTPLGSAVIVLAVVTVNQEAAS